MRSLRLGLVAFAIGEVLLAQIAPEGPRPIPYVDARAALDGLRREALPGELADLTPGAVEKGWPAWVSAEDQRIRARVEKGDEDSIVNLLLFGTTFTARPRVTERGSQYLAKDPARAANSFPGRIDDLISGLRTLQGNQRLDFVRDLIRRKGIDVATDDGRSRLRAYLREHLARVAAEIATYDRAIDSAALAADSGLEFLERATLFRDRGLSSDTSLFTDYAIEQALRVIHSRGDGPPGGIRRVAVVGPGLDFVDKHEGFDFYPPQSIQPFTMIDSLSRLGLAAPGRLDLVTLDLSPRINQHLTTARQQAQQGHGYVVHLPRDLDVAWHPGLQRYWATFGDQIGEVISSAAAPLNLPAVVARAITVRPPVVMTVTPQVLNVVTERLTDPSGVAQFDLVIATNVLIYYDAFRQSLALVNIAAMLRPGGLLVVNGRLFVLPSIPLDAAGQLDVIYTFRPETGEVGDKISWFRRRQ